MKEFGLFYSCFLFFRVSKAYTDGHPASNKLAGLGLKVLTPERVEGQNGLETF